MQEQSCAAPPYLCFQGKKYANKVVKNVPCYTPSRFDIIKIQNESILSCKETDKNVNTACRRQKGVRL